MVLKTVLKVVINCPKCKRDLIKIVARLLGVDKIEVDEGKGTLTVTGDADPIKIVASLQKAVKHVEIVSIGPPPAPPKDAQKKAEEDKKAEEKNKAEEKKKPDPVKQPPQPYMQMPCYYPPYHQVALVHMHRCEEPNPSCTIL